MQVHAMFIFAAVTLFSHAVYSLPAINYTDTAVPNEMIKTLSEALYPSSEVQKAASVDPRGKNRT